MSAMRPATFHLAIALAIAATPARATASDPLADPLAIARDIPTFRAPAEPPDPASEPPPAPVEPAAPLSLRGALTLALRGNPGLAELSWEGRASEARLRRAGGIPDPEVDVRLYRLEERSGVSNVRRNRVIFSQEFELGGKRRRRVDVAESGVEAARWGYESQRVALAAGVAVRFAAVLGAQRRVETWRGLIDELERLKKRVDTLVQTGSMRSVEVHRVARQTGLARIDLQRAESELATARFRLAATWGGTVPRFTEAVGELEPLAPVPALEAVLELAQASPDMMRWEAKLAGRKARVSLAKADRVPDLTVGAGLRWIPEIDEHDYLLDFEISLPLFNGKQGAVREALHDLAKARAGRAASRARDSASIAEAYHALVESRTRGATLSEEVIPAIRAGIEAFGLAFETRAANVDDLIDARRDLARAEVDLTDARVDYHEALARLESLVGRPLREVGSEGR